MGIGIDTLLEKKTIHKDFHGLVMLIMSVSYHKVRTKGCISYDSEKRLEIQLESGNI